MNAHITFGLFALYVALVSLYLVLTGHQDALLALLRRFWGRTLGHALYFVARVALPMLICVICLGWGVRQYDTRTAFHDFAAPPELNLDYYRNLHLLLQQENPPDMVDAVYGA